ncbi:unnamed protein product [Lota lota]
MRKWYSGRGIGRIIHSEEFLPHLRAAAAASGTAGMSCSKAAVISISFRLSSMDGVSHTYSVVPAFPYRISKV